MILELLDAGVCLAIADDIKNGEKKELDSDSIAISNAIHHPNGGWIALKIIGGFFVALTVLSMLQLVV